MSREVSVRAIEDGDRAWLRGELAQWGMLRLVSRGRLTEDSSLLSGFLAESGGDPVGFALLRKERDELEVVALKSLRPGTGIGTALLAAAREEAASTGCRRVWLITTNDNLHAVRFYQRRGWDWVAFHRDAVSAGRKLKPEIPETGADGIAIRHEIEFEERNVAVKHTEVQTKGPLSEL